MPLALLLACVEYGLGVRDSVASPVEEDRDGYGTATIVIPAEPPSCPLRAAAVTTWLEATCGAVDFRGFEMKLKARFDHPSNEISGYMSAPIVIPKDGRGVVAASAKRSDDADDLLDILFVDGVTAQATYLLGVPDVEPWMLAASRALSPNAAPGDWGLYASAWDKATLYRFDLDTGAAKDLGLQPEHGWGTTARDVDFDGVADVMSGGSILTSKGVTLRTFSDPAVDAVGPVLFDSSGTGGLIIAWPGGLSDVETDTTTPWAWPGRPSPYAVAAIGAADGVPFEVVLGTQAILQDALGVVDLSETGLWGDDERSTSPASIGDLDGDGLVDAAYLILGDARAVHVEGPHRGEVFASWQVLDIDGSTANLVLSDLDADGAYEIVVVGSAGFFLLDAGTGRILWEDRSITLNANYQTPIVADVDMDGSAEIIFIGDDANRDYLPWTDPEVRADTIFIFGPAEGEWARSRPIWNQYSYDITTVRDDGAIVRFPRPSWSQYNAYRAQPAHDGEHPDLAPRVTQVCADVCGPGGTVTLTAEVDNLGSVDASAGASIVLSTWAEGETWISEVARSTLPDVVSSGTTTGVITFTVPWEQWKDARVIDVWGTHEDECDYVNDRIDVAEDPCAPE